MKSKIQKGNFAYWPAVVTVMTVMTVLILFTGQWPWEANSYHSYVLQADAWLHGRLDLGQNYKWLELAIYGGKYYVSFPPFPSYVMLPFVWLFGTGVPDHWIAIFSTLIGVVYTWKLCRQLSCSEDQATFYTLFLYLGTGLMFVSINGYVWFIAQNFCFTLSVMSLYYALKERGGVSLTLWACAVGCRPMVAVYVPLLLWILCRQWRVRHPQGRWHEMMLKRWYWCIGAVLIALSYMTLNLLRFGSVIEFGHNYLPEFTRTTTGQFNLSYLVPNVRNLFRLPQSGQTGEALRFPTSDGVAFWLVTPLFLTVMAAWMSEVVRKKKESWFLLIVLPLLALFHVFIIVCHKTLGGWHFGNRYLLDTLPYLFYGMLVWRPKGNWFDRLNVILCAGGAAINLIGMVAVYNSWI